MKVLFISKKPKSASWSDAIIKLREGLNRQPDTDVIPFEIDTGGISNYLKNSNRLKPILESGTFDLIFVNHVICAWPILKVLKDFNGTKVLALHETEPVLGYSYLFSNIFRIPIKHWIRYPRYWNSNPIGYFDKVFILNKRQAIFSRHKNKYEQLNYLGVDSERFSPKENQTIPRVGFFPFGPDRFEKGFDIAKAAMDGFEESQLKKGGSIPFSEMPAVYHNSGFLLLPTLYETYSLVLLEAFASNIFVIANESVGLIENLLEKYSREELLNFGVYVCERSVVSFKQGVAEILMRIENGERPRTRELLEREGLSDEKTARRVGNRLKELIGENA